MSNKFDGRLTAPLAEILLFKVAEGVERGRAPEDRRGSLPATALDAADVLADAGQLSEGNHFAEHCEGYF